MTLSCAECAASFERPHPRGRVPRCCPPCAAAVTRRASQASNADYIARCREIGVCFHCPRRGAAQIATRYGLCEPHAARMDANARRHSLARFGLTEAGYIALLERQAGVCAICATPPDYGKRLAVDHDHRCCPGVETCGECIRGLLCSGCNTGIGLLGDDADRLTAAAAYLLEHRPRPSQTSRA